MMNYERHGRFSPNGQGTSLCFPHLWPSSAKPQEPLRLAQQPLGTFHILAKHAQQCLVVSLCEQGGRVDTEGTGAHGEAAGAVQRGVGWGVWGRIW